jgi:hypothetical protein
MSSDGGNGPGKTGSLSIGRIRITEETTSTMTTMAAAPTTVPIMVFRLLNYGLVDRMLHNMQGSFIKLTRSFGALH